MSIVCYFCFQKIKARAQEVYFNLDSNQTVEDGCDSYMYYNAKTLKIYKPKPGPPPIIDENSTFIGPNTSFYLPLYLDWNKYYQVPVSLNASAVHVPTNIYDCGK